MAELPYMTYLQLMQNIIMFILNCLTFCLLFRTLYTKIKTLKNVEISPQFMVYLVTVFLMAIINGIKSGYAVFVWFKGTNDPIVIYITGIVGLIIGPVVSLAVFFLVLHRTLIITRFITHSNIHQLLTFPQIL
uniref:Uncharacterized protein n=1 Tax=Panagrolaimus davidi TaxID=227884 RepID=A0A914PRD4_9BILA